MVRKESSTKAQERERQEDLIRYYKSRIGDFEQERASLLESVEKCSVQASELHRLDWENRKRADEVRELQKALSDAHAFLFEERQRLLAAQAENDELRLQEIEDRKRIQQLLNYDGGRANSAMPHYMEQPALDTLMLKIESLQAQLSEQKQLAGERVAALLEDRRIREQEEAAHRAHMNMQLEQMAKKLTDTEETLRQTTKDFILARRERQAMEETLLSAEAVAAAERSRLAAELHDVRKKAAEELSQQKAQAERRMEDVTGNLRTQLKEREHELVNLASVHTATKAQLERRVGELETKSGKLAESNKQLELRRHMDMEGFTADITTLRKSLAAVERKLHEMRLVERLGDDDRLDTIIGKLRKQAPSVLPTPNDQSETSSVAGGRARSGGSDKSAKADVAKSLSLIKDKLRVVEDGLQVKKKALNNK